MKKKLKAGVIGFGKAGKAVAATILRNKDICLEWVIRKSDKLEHRSIPEFLGEESDEPGLIYSINKTNITNLLNEKPVDVIIDFSSEDGIHYYGNEAAKKNIKIISAVSHYNDKEKELINSLSESTAVLWSPNITIGVNYLILAAKFLKKIYPDIDMAIIEEHYKDKPEISGTALSIASNLNIDSSEIKSIRAGGIIGKHEIICGFPFQTVRLIHESITREAFGNGAIFAAKNLINKDKGLYSFEEILLPYFVL